MPMHVCLANLLDSFSPSSCPRPRNCGPADAEAFPLMSGHQGLFLCHASDLLSPYRLFMTFLSSFLLLKTSFFSGTEKKCFEIFVSSFCVWVSEFFFSLPRISHEIPPPLALPLSFRSRATSKARTAVVLGRPETVQMLPRGGPYSPGSLCNVFLYLPCTHAV